MFVRTVFTGGAGCAMARSNDVTAARPAVRRRNSRRFTRTLQIVALVTRRARSLLQTPQRPPRAARRRRAATTRTARARTATDQRIVTRRPQVRWRRADRAPG